MSKIYIEFNAFRCSICTLRLHNIEGGLLWARALQRARSLQLPVEPVPRPEPVRFLGRIPPNRASDPAHRPADHDRFQQVHESDEPQHHHGLGLPYLTLKTELACSVLLLSFN